MSEIERDRILDHEYDGIREYDNPLPGWWVMLFLITIVFAVGYWFYYPMGEGETEIGQYNRQMLALADLQMKELLKLGPITDRTILGLQKKPDLMTGARATFAARCAVCHGANGEGKIGPNLTDKFWLHGGRLTDIYHTITEGVPDKGMISWKTQMGPGEILAVAAYVGTLSGSSPPNPKAPQGTEVASTPNEMAENTPPAASPAPAASR